MRPPRLISWQKAALALAARIGRDRLIRSVCALADQAGRRKWIVAVSGGADSVALLLLIWAHWPKHRDRLVVAHFNHRLRGKFSGADARFCRGLAKALGVHFESEAWSDVPENPNEATARDARNMFLEKVRRQHRARFIWTGHQQDDVAESILMRLSRGSGAAGLAAPRAIQREMKTTVVRLRPLLDLKHENLATALRAAGAKWREDESNQSSRYFRNRIRGEVIPVWQQAAGRDAVGGAARSRVLLEEDDNALNAWLEEIAPIDPDGRLALRKLRGKPTAIWRRALRQWLGLQVDSGDLSRAGFEDLLALARAGRTSRFSLGKSGFVRIRREFLFFEQPSR